jgi:hypothetical protein
MALKVQSTSKEDDVQKTSEIERRVHPTTRKDFSVLHAELQGIIF